MVVNPSSGASVLGLAGGGLLPLSDEALVVLSRKIIFSPYCEAFLLIVFEELDKDLVKRVTGPSTSLPGLCFCSIANVLAFLSGKKPGQFIKVRMEKE